MPTVNLKSMTAKRWRKFGDAERKWDAAKEIAKKEYNLDEKKPRFWPIVVGIVREIFGLKKESFREYIENRKDDRGRI